MQYKIYGVVSCLMDDYGKGSVVEEVGATVKVESLEDSHTLQNVYTQPDGDLTKEGLCYNIHYANEKGFKPDHEQLKEIIDRLQSNFVRSDITFIKPKP